MTPPPIASSTPAPIGSAVPPAAVLVVDDDPATRHLLRAMLEPEGYAVLDADDGVAALPLLRVPTAPYVTLLDYQMPRLDGWALLRLAVADSALLTQHAFILITANRDALPPAFVTLLQQLGIPTLAKPIGRRPLLTAVARAAQLLTATPPVPPTGDTGPLAQPGS
jgi:CheY-like chemotaxis protein